MHGAGGVKNMSIDTCYSYLVHSNPLNYPEWFGMLACFYCYLYTYFTPLSSVFIVDFEQANISWVERIQWLQLLSLLLTSTHFRLMFHSLLTYFR